MKSLVGFGIAGIALLSSAAVTAQVEQVRFGNLHAHTSYSDGLGVPQDAHIPPITKTRSGKSA